MITGIFGVPGSGKTTLIAYYVKKNKKKYQNIYTINCSIKGAERIKWQDLAEYKFTNSLILIDEITLDADNRDFKNFDKRIRDFFILHRHCNTDIVWVTQNYNKVDVKIQDLTADLWYMYKPVVPILREFTKCRRIYREMKILENSAELKLGYRFCNFLEKIFASNTKIIWRRKYYKMFDTHELLTLADRKEYRERITKEEMNEIWKKNFGVPLNA